MRDEECNILQNLSRDEFREFRTLVIDMVLATDMSFHFQQLKNMRSLLSLAEPGVDKSKAVSLVLHCCDISHPAKVHQFNINLHKIGEQYKVDILYFSFLKSFFFYLYHVVKRRKQFTKLGCVENSITESA